MADRYGIIGYPLRHSLSPFMHFRYAYYLGVEETYELFETPPGKLHELLTESHRAGILGMNVTIPYKNEIIRYLYDIDPAAAKTGAVNTLKYSSNGYIGFNTDTTGLQKTLETKGIDVFNKDILILGAGGAARAAAYVCRVNGCRSISVLNRTPEHAQGICSDFNCGLYDYDSIAKLDKPSYIAFQTTSVGMYPDTGKMLTLPESLIRRFESAIDVIYNPPETVFFKTVSSMGIKAVNGFDMLIYQGLASRHIWKPDEIITDDIRRRVYHECSCYKWS
ncbi:MAG: shikimate dehydrogenase [Lachnospiraceae bacterium]|nr:shikimate dehydrogenase [Candidatus Darwinimomas equi]